MARHPRTILPHVFLWSEFPHFRPLFFLPQVLRLSYWAVHDTDPPRRRSPLSFSDSGGGQSGP